MFNKYIICTLFLSFSAYSACSEIESTQLTEINKKSASIIDINNSEIVTLENEINDNFPEKSTEMKHWKNAWKNYAKSKCDYLNFESKGTDAEYANFNHCYAEEQKRHMEEIKQILLNPIFLLVLGHES